MNTSCSRFRPHRAFRGLLTFAVVVLCVRSALCLGPQPEVEPNNTPATATALTPEDFDGWFFGVPGSLWPAGDVDYFQIPLQAGSRLWLLVDTGGTQHPAGTSRDSILEVLTPDGTTVLELDDDDGTGNGHGSVISSLEASASLSHWVAGGASAVPLRFFPRVGGATSARAPSPPGTWRSMGRCTVPVAWFQWPQLCGTSSDRPRKLCRSSVGRVTSVPDTPGPPDARASSPLQSTGRSIEARTESLVLHRQR